jgi:hypothetical protein
VTDAFTAGIESNSTLEERLQDRVWPSSVFATQSSLPLG